MVVKDPLWMFTFLGLSVAMQLIYVYGTYIILWLNSFKESGLLDDENQVRDIFSLMTLLDAPGILLVGLTMAFIADHVSTANLVIPAFVTRSGAFFAFTLVNDPRSPFAYMASIGVTMSSIVAIISLETLFMKRLPREVAGAMAILQAFFIAIGALLFNAASG